MFKLFLSRISLVRDFFFAFIFVNIIICKYLYINLRIENNKNKPE
jgi:hypothetical protein